MSGQLLRLIEDGDHEGAIALVQSGRCDVNEVGSALQTPLQEAATDNAEALVEALLRARADPNAQDEDGMTALHTASRKGYTGIVEQLLRAGAEINTINSDGLTALHFAAHRGHLRAAEALLAAGASVTTPDHYDDLPIHFAASEGHVEIIAMLLRRGSPVAPQTNRGNTPLHLAAIKGKYDAVLALLEAGSEVLPNGSGQTPLQVAEAKNKIDCAKAIRQYEGMAAKVKRAEEEKKLEEQKRQLAQQPPHLQHAESELGMDPGAFIAPGEGPIIPATIKPGMTAMDLTNMNNFVMTPPKIGLVLQGKIHREKYGMFGGTEIYKYQLENKLSTVLLAAKKRKESKTSNFAISTNYSSIKSVGRKDPEFIAKLRSNFAKSDYFLYDDGENPAKTTTSRYDTSALRKELGVVQYKEKYPREITVLIPERKSVTEAVVWQPTRPADSMLAKFQAGGGRGVAGLTELKNKSPSWNSKINGYVLDFYGRVLVKSSKNFQLILATDDNSTDSVLLLFGRTEKNEFTLDFQYPLTPVQAFAIALTAFDTY